MNLMVGIVLDPISPTVVWQYQKQNFNVIYKYPISNYRIDDANINVSLTYSGQVQFSSFVSYNPSSDTWIKQTQKKTGMDCRCQWVCC